MSVPSPPTSAWEFRIDVDRGGAAAVARLIEVLSAAELDGDPITRSRVSVWAGQLPSDSLSMSATWGVECLCPPCQEQTASSGVTEIKHWSLAIDHVAVCVPPESWRATHDRLLRIAGSGGPRGPQTLETIKEAVDFAALTVGGVGVNLITPVRTVPHIVKFLTRFPLGGVLHLGIMVDSMYAAIEACRASGIPLLSDQLRAVRGRGRTEVRDGFDQLVRTGFAEQRMGEGRIRQTFAFPGTPGSPFFELIQRDNCTGYGDAISPLLIAGLDAVLG